MQRMVKPWEPGASLRQRAVPAVAAVVMVAALVYVLLPFTFAGVVKCSSAFGGSQADPDTPAGITLGNADESCANTGGERLVTAGVIAAAALVLGLAGAFLPSDEESGDVLAREPADGDGEGDDGGGDR
ncbi:MAG: hypothetical protein M3471_07495 [Actinomycetota bacterium]|nr:hypothetical protein [Actinomycetota bacterium]